MTVLRVDRSEPTDIPLYIQSTHPCRVEDLNDNGYADYVWDTIDGGRSNVERKTWRDLATKGEEVENQVRGHLLNHPECKNRLLIEGAIEPSPAGVFTYSRQHGRNVMVGTETKGPPGMYKRIMGQVLGWSEYLEIVYSASYAATAITLAELYERDQKPDDLKTTFRRYFKSLTWRPNMQVNRLLGMAQNDSNLGPAKCEDIIDSYGTVWYAIHREPKEWASIPGIGEATARKFMRNIGRSDV